MRQPGWPVRRAAAALGLGCAVLLSASAASPAPAGPAFVNGSGDSAANLGRVVARASGLPLATTWGGARAHYQGTTARGEAAALDLGVFGFMLTTPMGCGQAPLRPDQLPKRTVADSSRGEGTASKDFAGRGPVGAGRESARARPGARGEGSFTAAALELDGLLSLGQGTSFGAAELIPGEARRAEATVHLDRVDIAGGLVSLRGLRWATEQRTGPGGEVQRAEGTFGLDTIVVAGLPLPTATPLELAAAFGVANEVLGAYGLRLEPPQVTKSTGDREVRVTPLKLVLGDGTVARPLLGPLMEGLQPGREALLEAMRNFGRDDCDLGQAGGAAFTFVDVVAAALQGSGGIDLELGGVLATTEGIDYGDPFGVIEPGKAPLPLPPGPVVQPAPEPDIDELAGAEWDGLESGAPAVPQPTVSPAAPEEAAAPVATAPEPETVAAATRRCESTSRGRAAGCSRGAPRAAGAAALAVALGLFGGDWWRSRRRAAKEVPR